VAIVAGLFPLLLTQLALLPARHPSGCATLPLLL